MTDSSKRQQGLAMIEKVYGNTLPAGSLTPPGESKFIDFMLETVFGELWTRDVLSMRERRLLLLGAIAAQGEDNVFGIQVTAALNNGEFTPEQMQEAVLFLTQYVGFPRASKLHVLLTQLLRQRAAG
jgi:4-carboxymuconolactone decarboxylase